MKFNMLMYRKHVVFIICLQKKKDDEACMTTVEHYNIRKQARIKNAK